MIARANRHTSSPAPEAPAPVVITKLVTVHAAEIHATAAYSLAEFGKRTGLKKSSMRRLEDAGLKIRRVPGGKAFIIGSDWLDFLLTKANEPKRSGKRKVTSDSGD